MLRSPTSRTVDPLGAPSVYSRATAAKTTNLTGLLRAQKPVSFMAKTNIFRDGDPVDSIFLIASGSVCLHQFLPNGRRLISRFLFPDDIVGLWFTDEYPLTAQCITPTTVFKFERSELNALCAHSPALQGDVMRALKQDLTTEHEDHLPMLHQAAHARVARLLLMIARRNNPDCRNDEPIQLSMSRGDIADYLGLTLETVCRTFTKLKGDGCICASSPEQIWIKDFRKLSALIEGY
jgi:CRP/FNR family transcriptional regulator